MFNTLRVITVLVFLFTNPWNANAVQIKQDGVFACRSPEAWHIFQDFRITKNIYGIKNAIRNRECINLPLGKEVTIVQNRGSGTNLLVVTFDRDAEQWWISLEDTLSAIEIEEMVNSFLALGNLPKDKHEKLIQDLNKLSQDYKRKNNKSSE